MSDYDLIVIGAGVSGLDIAAQYVARNRGARVIILERDFTVGGRMKSLQGQEPDELRRTPARIMPSEGSSLLEKVCYSLGIMWEPTMGVEGEAQFGPAETNVPAYKNQYHTFSEGGEFALVQRLLEVVKQDGVEIVTGSQVLDITDNRQYVTVRTNGETLTASKIVCTVPPRELVRNITFNPPLESQRVNAMEDIATWKHNPALVEFTYEKKFWQDYHLEGPQFEGPCFQFYTGYNETDGLPMIVGYAHIPPQIGDNLTNWTSQQLAEKLRGQFSESQVFDFLEVSVRRWPKQNYVSLYEKGHNDIRPAKRIASAPAYQGKLLFTGTEYAQRAPGFVEGCFEATQHTMGQIFGYGAGGRDEYSDYSFGSEYSGSIYGAGIGGRRIYDKNGKLLCDLGYWHKGKNPEFRRQQISGNGRFAEYENNHGSFRSNNTLDKMSIPVNKTRSNLGSADFDVIQNGNGSPVVHESERERTYVRTTSRS